MPLFESAVVKLKRRRDELEGELAVHRSELAEIQDRAASQLIENGSSSKVILGSTRASSLRDLIDAKTNALAFLAPKLAKAEAEEAAAERAAKLEESKRLADAVRKRCRRIDAAIDTVVAEVMAFPEEFAAFEASLQERPADYFAGFDISHAVDLAEMAKSGGLLNNHSGANPHLLRENKQGTVFDLVNERLLVALRPRGAQIAPPMITTTNDQEELSSERSEQPAGK